MNAVLALQRLAVDVIDLGIETNQGSSYSGSGCIAGPVDTGEG
jgi:hypothetical protein